MAANAKFNVFEWQVGHNIELVRQYLIHAVPDCLNLLIVLLKESIDLLAKGIARVIRVARVRTTNFRISFSIYLSHVTSV